MGIIIWVVYIWKALICMRCKKPKRPICLHKGIISLFLDERNSCYFS